VKRQQKQPSFPWRKLRVLRAASERTQFVSSALLVVQHGRVHVRLPENYHADVRVEVDVA
jgi:hypothetical protein